MAGQRVQKCFFLFRDFVSSAVDADSAKRLAIARIYGDDNQPRIAGGSRLQLASNVDALRPARLQRVHDDIVLVQP